MVDELSVGQRDLEDPVDHDKGMEGNGAGSLHIRHRQ